jgi:hypothetical protein
MMALLSKMLDIKSTNVNKNIKPCQMAVRSKVPEKEFDNEPMCCVSGVQELVGPKILLVR